MTGAAAALAREGFRHFVRRLRMLRAWIALLLARRALAAGEAELGWLGWERVDFNDPEISAQAGKVREFERTQAALMNAAAELSARKEAAVAQFAGETTAHDQAREALAAERAPLVEDLARAEARRRLKLEADGRFNRALAELDRLERRLEARSLSFMKIDRPGIEIRRAARETSDELVRLPEERKHVLSDQAAAAAEAARLAPEIDRLRSELRRIDAADSAARDRLAAAKRRLGATLRQIERERRKSKAGIHRLDREKRRPYRAIGACLADHGIAPLNQPAVLDRVLALRERETLLAAALADLKAACAAAPLRLLIPFYLLLTALLIAILFIALHFPGAFSI